jgi:hypothetical protein
MNEIILNDEQYKMAKGFALESYSYHFRNGRSDTKVINNIIQGKLGEIAYYEMNKDVLATKLDLNPSTMPDPGWDFVDSNGSKIDVKTIKEGTKTITFNSSVKADLYAIIEIGIDNIFRIKGTKTKQDLKTNMRSSKFNDSKYIFV